MKFSKSHASEEQHSTKIKSMPPRGTHEYVETTHVTKIKSQSEFLPVSSSRI